MEDHIKETIRHDVCTVLGYIRKQTTLFSQNDLVPRLQSIGKSKLSDPKNSGFGVVGLALSIPMSRSFGQHCDLEIFRKPCMISDGLLPPSLAKNNFKVADAAHLKA